ncbi:MAG TPA: hypothetical protein VFP97_00825 [Chitinophagaceae bacterium]|nr:hypothetical protein [Chitinophagaceae bacterium]
MKHFFQLTVALAILTAATFALSFFLPLRKTANTESYSIHLSGKASADANNNQ